MPRRLRPPVLPVLRRGDDDNAPLVDMMGPPCEDTHCQQGDADRPLVDMMEGTTEGQNREATHIRDTPPEPDDDRSLVDMMEVDRAKKALEGLAEASAADDTASLVDMMEADGAKEALEGIVEASHEDSAPAADDTASL
eukprot:Hpha_TRINITY_DN16689_c2_g3::TRINITY_DN16689_c2_g3_i1::g.182964::m.182964